MLPLIILVSTLSVIASGYKPEDCMVGYNQCIAKLNERMRRGIYPSKPTGDCSDNYETCMEGADAPSAESLEPGYVPEAQRILGMVPGLTAYPTYTPTGSGNWRQGVIPGFEPWGQYGR